MAHAFDQTMESPVFPLSIDSPLFVPSLCGLLAGTFVLSTTAGLFAYLAR